MRFNSKILFLIIISLISSLFSQTRQYRSYKVSKKKETIVIPFKSQSLSPAICNILNENLISEIMKTRKYEILNRYPGFNLNKALCMPVENLDIYRLSELSDIAYLIIPTVEKTDMGFEITIELYNVSRISLLMNYKKQCECPFEDIVFLSLPEAADKLSMVNFNLPTKCPDDMVKFESTVFTMGSDNAYDNNPPVQVRLKSFCIDKFEFPNKMGQKPFIGKSWHEAHNLCKSKNKRLCTEFEWEHACRGKFNFIYPYGNQYMDEKCNTEGKEQKNAGSFVDCHGQKYIYDMSGNVNEWTGSNWDGNIQNKVIRGGGWSSKAKDSKCTLRYSNNPDIKAKTIGFRCCTSSR